MDRRRGRLGGMMRVVEKRYGRARAIPAGPYETRAVLGGAYPGKNPPLKYMLTHTVAAATDEPLCKRVRAESIADRFADDISAPPTCPICLRRDPRFSSQG